MGANVVVEACMLVLCGSRWPVGVDVGAWVARVFVCGIYEMKSFIRKRGEFLFTIQRTLHFFFR